MWLGVFAVIVAVSFALIKFLCTMHMRRLTDRRLRFQNDVKRTASRLKSLEGKLQVQRSRKDTVKQKLTTAGRYKEEMHGRLRLELPEAMLAELDSCVDRNPVPEPGGVKLFHLLHLGDRIAQALDALAVAVIEFTGSDHNDRTLLQSEFALRLEQNSIRHADVAGGSAADGARPLAVVCVFDDTVTAVKTIREFILATGRKRVGGIRGALVSGVHTSDDDGGENLDRLFARGLDTCQHLASIADDGALLINGAAYEGVPKTDAIGVYSKVDKLYVLKWTDLLDEEEAATETKETSGQGEKPNATAQEPAVEQVAAGEASPGPGDQATGDRAPTETTETGPAAGDAGAKVSDADDSPQHQNPPAESEKGPPQKEVGLSP